MASRNLGVIGWQNHCNIGDEAFAPAFKKLWHDYTFTFFDSVPTDWEKYDAFMIGGGSIVDSEILDLDKIKKPLAFVGIGTGDNVNERNLLAMKKAKIVLTRNQSQWIKCPDLVFARDEIRDRKATKENKILVLLNNHFCPYFQSPKWHDQAWSWFVSEFSQALDRIVFETGFQVVFMPMCVNPTENDNRAVAYIVDQMRYKEFVSVCGKASEEDILSEISNSKLVITQRFHGMIFSTMLNVPFLAICGHRKMLDFVKELGWDGHVPYYGFTISGMMEAIKFEPSGFVEYTEKAVAEWKGLSALVDQELFGSQAPCPMIASRSHNNLAT